MKRRREVERRRRECRGREEVREWRDTEEEREWRGGERMER